MRHRLHTLVMLLLFLSPALRQAHTGILATREDIINGKKNLADPLFLDAAAGDTGLDAAVRALLTGDILLSRAAKATVLRSTINAVENLPEARGRFDDVSAVKLYESLLIYDLIPDKSVFSNIETESLRSNWKSILQFYSHYDNFAWDDDRWNLGATALRIVAAEALFSFDFPGDPDSDGFRAHSLRYLLKNIEDSIDEYGAWTADAPGRTDEAMEYIIVTAKAFRNAGIRDVFSDPGLIRAFTYEVRLLPPRSPQLQGARFFVPPVGETDPGENHGGTVVMAATDIGPYAPETASNLAWYWNRCGNPAGPLGILFIDTSIPPVEPSYTSALIGNGSAVFRDDYGMPDESYVFTCFGGVSTPTERNGYNHPDSGEFSFVWRGIPLVFHEGFGGDECAGYFADRSAWRHDLTLYNGAGDSPVVPERLLYQSTVRKDVTGGGSRPQDFYPDGICQFLSTSGIDYVSGEIRLPGIAAPPTSYHRHILFLKPDALLVWDQMESPFPLEWNLWIPCNNVWAEGNVLHLPTRQNVDLQVYFAGDTSLDYAVEPFPGEVSWDWPIVMRTEFGDGEITVVCPDLLHTARPDSSEFPANILENLMAHGGGTPKAAVLSRDDILGGLLERKGIPWEPVRYETMSTIDLSRYTHIVIDSRLSALHERILMDFGWKINEFIRQGGAVVLFGDPHTPWLSDFRSNPDDIPFSLTLGDCPLPVRSDEFRLKLHPDAIWNEPNPVTREGWHRWLFGNSPGSGETAETVLTSIVPTAWSDSWKVLASIPHTFPLKVRGTEDGTAPRRIRVRHPASKDFFTLFLPRKMGDPTYLFDVKRTNTGYVSFADPVRTWEIKAGETTWTDANLSVLVDSLGMKKMYAFDCTYFRVGMEIIEAQSPISIYYSEIDDGGLLMTTDNNVISSSKYEIKPYAGVIRFRNLFGDISLERLTYITTVEVVDENGAPLKAARLYNEGRFMGFTDDRGLFPMRWMGKPPTIRVYHRGKESLKSLAPGRIRIVIGS